MSNKVNALTINNTIIQSRRPSLVRHHVNSRIEYRIRSIREDDSFSPRPTRMETRRCLSRSVLGIHVDGDRECRPRPTLDERMRVGEYWITKG